MIVVRGTKEYDNKVCDVQKRKIAAAQVSDKSIEEFRALVWDFWKEHGRHDLAWRQPSLKLRSGKQNFDPYNILVSEVMLQQTQVPRVIQKYAEFLHAFPTIESLAAASLQEVLKVWSGMGYNRRAKFLKMAAEEIVSNYKGKVSRDSTKLRELSGVGPYTASAILVFAYNVPDTLIETNVRTAFIHHFFPISPKKSTKAHSTKARPLFYKGRAFVSNSGDKLGDGTKDVLINDRDLLPLIARAAEGQDPREWHWALMDYGSHLKKLHKNPSRRSMHHVKQSKFEGSVRQVRGAILKVLTNGLKTEAELLKQSDLRKTRNRFTDALASLERDGMIKKEKSKWKIV